MHRRSLVPVLTLILLAAASCGRQDHPGVPLENPYLAKDGTETLGEPSIAIASGSGVVEGGASMVGVAASQLDVTVPAGATVVQALLYWAGGSADGLGDDTVTLDGVPVQGQRIGGPTLFYDTYRFSAYRADITNLNLVHPGANSLILSGFDFASTIADENDGASIVVIYDDGTAADIELRDGLDMAYFGFQPTLNSTVPQAFAVTPADEPRTAELVILAASVGADRPNRIVVTTPAGDQVFDNALGSFDGLQWDSLVLPVALAAGDDELSVELISTNSESALGASMGWVVAGLSVPVAEEPEPGEEISGRVYVDTDRDGFRDDFEWGIPGVVLTLSDLQGQTYLATSAEDGSYAFSAPAGDYTLEIDLSTAPEAFNSDLAVNFDPTTPVSVPVSVPPAAAGLDFGFVPRTAQIIQDFENGDLQSDALTARHWRMLFRRALIEEQSNRQGDGHDEHDLNDPDGWGHDENYYDADELRAILADVSGLYFIEPYQFTPGSELREAYDLIHTRPRGLEEELLREMFVTELNYVTGRGIIGQADRTGVLISWGESLLNFVEEAAKARGEDLFDAIVIFENINTGGGGSVDE